MTMREEHRLRVLKNQVLRAIFGPKTNEVRGEWRKIHNDEFDDLYFSPNSLGDKIEKNEMGRACMGGEGCVQGFGGET